ncbi:prolyl oligopeptidase family serine peptidase [Stieleria tagensis]|uniref:prolyl oligopeptidase family serine peptidase n=1 Tax=Stieleria tagensis TaxID=2956795 RepID=UPI00209BB201|nr:prolyl oligopeptidase family serine peptidase [Stieleria tagensis]
MTSAWADGPADNDAATVRPIPPVGMELTDAQTKRLTEGCAAIRKSWQETLSAAGEWADSANRFQQTERKQVVANLKGLTPEVLVFPRAVEIAMEFQQFYQDRDIENALLLLNIAQQRIEIAESDPRWSRVVGIGAGDSQQLVIGGYQSKIDGSYQPYALVVPAGYTHGDARPRRLDLWFHGRGEKMSEANFLANGRNNAGQYTPADTIVLHPYGRYSNAFKFAGEIDVLEAMEYVSGRLPVDPARCSVRGFSMGGAGCWQFATHYADRFFAANPGAGFSETPEFLKSFQSEDLSSTPGYQRTLWQLYDCPPWSRNLVMCPTVAYSGEIDRQKQAADVMQQSLAQQGIDLVHLIGPKTAHQIHPDSKIEIEHKMDALAAAATVDVPRHVDFTTYTLRYHKMHWVDVQGLQKHWSRAHVSATLDTRPTPAKLSVVTKNVSRLRLDFSAGQWRGPLPCQPKIHLDGTTIIGPAVRSDRSWQADLEFDGVQWKLVSSFAEGLAKRPGLQGPIDDAFMDSFLFVLPSARSDDTVTEKWFRSESEHAQTHWRKHFRGDIRTVVDTELTDQQIADHNLVLFGDDQSNSIIKRIAADLPVQWAADSIRLGEQQFDRAAHAIAMVYPNPLNPDRYIVLNSGVTFREYDYLNNARQTPKLPDWAIIDVSQGATMRDPGKIEAAGFFDESWKP